MFLFGLVLLGVLSPLGVAKFAFDTNDGTLAGTMSCTWQALGAMRVLVNTCQQHAHTRPEPEARATPNPREP